MISLYRKRYHAQKHGAKVRNIEWQFTFDEWLAWWGDDIVNRGCRKGQLVMARKGDIGPYHPDNVFKTTCEENCKDGNKGKLTTEETRVKLRLVRKQQIFTIETRTKMSETRKGVGKSEETKAKMKLGQQKRREMEKML